MPDSQQILLSEGMQKKNLTLILICIALAVLTVIAYWPVKDYGFVNFDDIVYVYKNEYVQSGLSWNSIRWAFSVESMQRTSNWHPLTWLSLMFDYQLFGLNPHGYHLTNLLFHIINSILLFYVLHRMTKTLWQSLFVATLFALHPLHVESVAWIAERKDVLSTLFWMLTMGAYLFYVERPGLLRYLAVIVFFALGLMAKPMLVTLPFVLLLIDFWPLKRFEQMKTALAWIRPLLWEKVPFGYWQDSITLFDHTLKVTEDNVLAYVKRGIALAGVGNYRQAIGDCDRAIEIKPNSAEAYYSRGVAYIGIGNYRQAISDCDRAIEIKPNYAEAYNNRGVAYAKIGNYKQAISDFDRAIEIKPNYEVACNNRGAAYNKLGKP